MWDWVRTDLGGLVMMVLFRLSGFAVVEVGYGGLMMHGLLWSCGVLIWVFAGLGLIVWNGCGLSMVEEMMVVRLLRGELDWNWLGGTGLRLVFAGKGLSRWLRVCSKGRALLRRQMRGKWKLD
ncbi:hypothetical protein M0R45_036022 [Rubus argutus]|uniref:NADH dehydrogenase subunit 6 n=1 Tax=Rubus argutus TaxID=59490 RepID=A0AAW1VXE1_RUBAR